MMLKLDKVEMLLILEDLLFTNTIQVLCPPNPTIFPIQNPTIFPIKII